MTPNRNQVLEVATRVFVSAGTEPSMRAITPANLHRARCGC
jgi:hypothetical protein